MHAKSETHKTLNLALFDFDGTLYPRDSFTGFIFFALSKRHIIKRGLKILPWIQAYYLRLYPAHAMRPRLFETMFKDIPADVVEKLAQEYAQKLLKKLDQDLLSQLQQHQQRGDHIVLVSASVDLYLTPICEFLNIDLICTQTEAQDGLLTGSYNSEDCSCEQKKIRILQNYNLDDYHAIYAYGNSEEDLDMLSLADYAYMMGEEKALPPLEPSHLKTIDIKKPA
ncbi:HAD-IB family hydrolase [Acinetobacter sp. NIPH 2100]|uniref:HAD-IB family hydrolase n=1 Tax=Acinetobacter sp. NIPH 2100 TaxID=1217708 RepID=UPI0002CE459E|nr:HAD-IB family hydrolase [Acinetobacter sp. NIPH 2100]ENX41083.1 HAD hydrolase, family IB [Acinetobacter sp. NIPH 2100]